MRVELDGTRMDATVIAAAEASRVRQWPRLAARQRRPALPRGRWWRRRGWSAGADAGQGDRADRRRGRHGCQGAPLLILEAMKMEHTITAPGAGTVRAFRFGVGDQVGDGAELVDFEVAK